jgi:adenosine deaminase
VENSFNFYQQLPKVELHRHLEGSLRLKTMQEIARTHGITLPISTGPLSNLVQVQSGQPCTSQNFLEKFTTLRRLYRSPGIIQRITREAVEDAAKDNIRYLELRFSPVALSFNEDFPLGEVMDWVCSSAYLAASDFGILVRLIASVNRHESLRLAEQVAGEAVDRKGAGIVGLDLAGNETEFSALPFAGVFTEAHRSGLGLTVHAGEWGGASNVVEALEKLQADRIGHGVRVMEDPRVMALVLEHGTALEVCITSNLQTGVVASLGQHPFQNMLKAGLNVIPGTDNPSISQITLTQEYQRICIDLGMESGLLNERILAAAQAGFLPEAERDKLERQLRQELSI